jgi:hypothetical protein
MRHATALAAVMRVLSVLPLFMFDMLTVVTAQTERQNFFANPGLKGPLLTFFAKPVWSIGSTQTIKWRTNYENFTFTSCQQDPDFQESAIGPGPTVFYNAGPSGSLSMRKSEELHKQKPTPTQKPMSSIG